MCAIVSSADPVFSRPNIGVWIGRFRYRHRAQTAPALPA
jgi:hypothetical protein